jgi:hypothetical protein
MPKAFPLEFRRDVVAEVRRGALSSGCGHSDTGVSRRVG